MTKRKATTFYSSAEIAAAYACGVQAHKDGKSSACAQDKNLLDMIKPGAPMGTSLELINAWIKGWHNSNLNK